MLKSIIILGLFFKIKANYYEYYNNLPNYLKQNKKFITEKKKTIGFEFEVVFDYVNPNLTIWNNFLLKNMTNNKIWLNSFVIKDDPSIPLGIEFAFEPIYYKDVNKIYWKIFFDFLKNINAKVIENTSIQIHISKYLINGLDKIANYIYKNKNKMIKFMNRESTYAMIPNYNNYKKSKMKYLYHTKFFCVYDHKKYNTIEIRGFKMTINLLKFYSYVNFIDSLINFDNNLIKEYEILKNNNNDYTLILLFFICVIFLNI
tara:strand:+ start:2166 stop:2942 length:777 start_codon:yes stop_codon:yes gene_type:complete